MKKYLISFIVLVLLGGTSCQTKVDTEREKAAIKAVIENETNAFRTRQWDQQSNYFLQDENTVFLAADKNSYLYGVGWSKMSQGYKDVYKNNPDPITNKYQFTNFKIKVYKESAWAVYDENITNPEGKFLMKNINVRFLEKVDGKWKIVFLGYVNATSYAKENMRGQGITETEETK